MKFQKGLLSDDTPEKEREAVASAKFQKGLLNDVAPASQPTPKPKPAAQPKASDKHVVLQEDRLFETREEFEGNSRNYLKLLAIVVAVVAIAGAAIFYFTLPGIGDPIHAPAGAEDAVRDNLLFPSALFRSSGGGCGGWRPSGSTALCRLEPGWRSSAPFSSGGEPFQAKNSFA